MCCFNKVNLSAILLVHKRIILNLYYHLLLWSNRLIPGLCILNITSPAWSVHCSSSLSEAFLQVLRCHILQDVISPSLNPQHGRPGLDI